MNDWLVGIFGKAYATAAFWTIILLAVAIVLLVFLRANRRFTSGTFISGGRNRQPRLAVTDATPVDNHRRLVLVRRDDVEHLILIGGPSDVVIESDIAIQARDLDDATAPAPTAPAVDEINARADPDRSNAAVTPRIDATPEQHPAQETAPEAYRPERRSTPSAQTPRVAAGTAAPAAQAPNRYPTRERTETVQPVQQRRAPEIDTPAESSHNAAVTTRAAAAPAPSAPLRDERNGTASAAQPRPQPVVTSIAGTPQAAVAQASTSTKQDPANLESTLEDEMSRLLEEISEQKH